MKKARPPPRNAQRKDKVTQPGAGIFELDIKRETDGPTKGSGEEMGAWRRKLTLHPRLQLDGTQSAHQISLRESDAQVGWGTTGKVQSGDRGDMKDLMGCTSYQAGPVSFPPRRKGSL